MNWKYLEVNIEVWDTRKEVKDSLSNYLMVNGLRRASGPVLNHQTVTFILPLERKSIIQRAKNNSVTRTIKNDLVGKYSESLFGCLGISGINLLLSNTSFITLE